jgi:acetylornithine deacetylase
VSDINERVLSKLDRGELIRMAREIVEIPSPTGHEKAVADYIAGKFQSLGVRVRMQEVEADRSNVICTLKGTGGGKSLMLTGHMDTSSGYHQSAVTVDGDWLYGPGATNMKGFFPAAYIATKMLLEAGARLKGDLLTTAVVGELEVSAVEDTLHSYSGPKYRGCGIGTEFMLRHGVIADMAVIGEPTGLRVQCGNTGYIFLRVTTHGVQMGTHAKHKGVSALDKMVKVIHALQAWEPEYQRIYRHPRMLPLLNVGSITSGRPFGPQRTPPSAHLFVHLTTIPGTKPLELKHRLEDVVQSAGAGDPDFKAEIDFFQIRLGCEVPQDEYVAQAVERAHREIMGREPDPIEPTRYCVSSDGSFFQVYGIPNITYGPGGVTTGGERINRDARGEALNFDNLANCARVYALTALEACGGF